MSRAILFFWFYIFFIGSSCNSIELTQEQVELKSSLVPIRDISDLDDSLYKHISNYDIIMIGELHGTNEPAEFAFGLCDLIARKEGKVVLGMEISPSQMEGYNADMSIDQLKDLKFFNGENGSGMNGSAWLNLVARSNQNTMIVTEFFDYQKVAPRDSSMYNAICDIRKEYTDTKIVTLSGNLHNRLEPYDENTMLGGYLSKDTINFKADRIMSIMHFFSKGTMMNNVGNGLELRTIDYKDNVVNTATSQNSFFCKNVFKNRSHHTHILYTEEVTHSELLESQK